MKDTWLGGEVAVLYLFKAPLGVDSVRKRVPPQLLMSTGQVILMLRQV